MADENIEKPADEQPKEPETKPEEPKEEAKPIEENKSAE